MTREEKIEQYNKNIEKQAAIDLNHNEQEFDKFMNDYRMFSPEVKALANLPDNATFKMMCPAYYDPNPNQDLCDQQFNALMQRLNPVLAQIEEHNRKIEEFVDKTSSVITV